MKNARILLVVIFLAAGATGSFFLFKKNLPTPFPGTAAGAPSQVAARSALTAPVSSPRSIQQATQIASGVIGPKASFESSPDIWAFSMSRLGSKDSGELYEAYQASKECVGLLNLSPSLQKYASGVPDEIVSGSFDVVRQVAIDSLLKKCSGFLRYGHQAGKDLTEKLNEEGKTLGGPEFDLKQLPTSTDDAVAEFKKLGSESAKQQLIIRLDPLAERELENISGDLSNAAKTEITATSLMLAMCDLGRDCGKTSYSTLMQCAIMAKCGDSLWAGWEHGMSDGSVELVNKLTSRLVAILRSN